MILFEEIATHFGLKVPDAIDRLTYLVKEGRLTGKLLRNVLWKNRCSGNQVTDLKLAILFT